MSEGKKRALHAAPFDDDAPPGTRRQRSGLHLQQGLPENEIAVQATYRVRSRVLGDRALTLDRIDVLADGTVAATYASGRTYEYLSLEELLRSHRLSLSHLERVDDARPRRR